MVVRLMQFDLIIQLSALAFFHIAHSRVLYRQYLLGRSTFQLVLYRSVFRAIRAAICPDADNGIPKTGPDAVRKNNLFLIPQQDKTGASGNKGAVGFPVKLKVEADGNSASYCFGFIVIDAVRGTEEQVFQSFPKDVVVRCQIGRIGQCRISLIGLNLKIVVSHALGL